MRLYAPTLLLACVCFGQSATNLIGTAINNTNPDSSIRRTMYRIMIVLQK